jgi:hypothetical protein
MREIKMSCQRSMSPKKREIKDAMPKKHEPKNDEWKDSPYFQKFQSKRERNMTKEYKNLRKIFHTLAQSWSKCMTSLSYDPVFHLATWHDASMPLLHLPKLHISLIRW